MWRCCWIRWTITIGRWHSAEKCKKPLDNMVLFVLLAYMVIALVCLPDSVLISLCFEMQTSPHVLGWLRWHSCSQVLGEGYLSLDRFPWGSPRPTGQRQEGSPGYARSIPHFANSVTEGEEGSFPEEGEEVVNCWLITDVDLSHCTLCDLLLTSVWSASC